MKHHTRRKTRKPLIKHQDYQYTDGSGYTELYGVGIYGLGQHLQVSLMLENWPRFFKQRFYLSQNSWRTRRRKTKNKIMFSQIVRPQSKLLKASIDSKLGWSTMQALENVIKNNKVTLIDAPGHIDMQRNEMSYGHGLNINKESAPTNGKRCCNLPAGQGDYTTTQLQGSNTTQDYGPT